MDSVSSLPNTPRRYDAIWVIVDRLTKSAHFIPINISFPVSQLAEIYIREIVKLHVTPRFHKDVNNTNKSEYST